MTSHYPTVPYDGSSYSLVTIDGNENLVLITTYPQQNTVSNSYIVAFKIHLKSGLSV